MKSCLVLLAAFGLATTPGASAAAVVTAAEYFLNTDPGPGNGTMLPANVPATTAGFSITIPPAVINALPEGIHTLACRVKDDAGNWSVAFAGSFFKENTAPVDFLPPTVSISSVSPDPRNRPVDSLNIIFSEPVTGLNLADLRFERDFSPNLLTAAQTLTTTDNVTYVLGNLTALTGFDGSYLLTLAAANSGIVDLAGNALAHDVGRSWLMDRTAPVASITPVTPNPRNRPVESLTLEFREPVNGLSIMSGLSLSRNGGTNLLTAAQTLTTTDGLTYVLGNLAPLTGAEGTYTATLTATNSGVTDRTGNALAADARANWLVDNTAPVATMATITPYPRNHALASLSVVFSEPVTGLSLASLSLSRNGGPNLLTAAQTITTADQQTFVLTGLATLTSLDGTYTLALPAANSGITDTAGNPLAADALESWVMDQTPPVLRLAPVAPNPRNTPVTSLGLAFSEPITGLDLADFSLTEDELEVSLEGTVTLQTTDGANFILGGLANLTNGDGYYALTVRANDTGITDAAGNALAKSETVRWITDRTAPVASFSAITPDPRNSAVAVVTFHFSETVTGLKLTDLALNRNGSGNLLSGKEELRTLDGRNFSLSGLAPLTADDGLYTLALRAAGSAIIDTVGNRPATDATTRWTMDHAPPTVTINAVTPDPRNNAVESLSLVFSEPITGFDVKDLKLSRDGGPNLLAGADPLVTADGLTHTLGGLASLTGAAGTYTLSLIAVSAGISDPARNPLFGDAVETWTLAPKLAVVAEYFINTDPGPGNGTPVAATSANWPQPRMVEVPATVLATLPTGTHTLTCRARDVAGNWSIAFSRPFHKETAALEPGAMVESIEYQWFRDGQAAGAPQLLRLPAPGRSVSTTLVADIAGLVDVVSYKLLAIPVDSFGQRGIGVSRSVLIDRAELPRDFSLGSLQRLPNGTIRWTFTGETGRSYTVQSSLDLVHWRDLQTVTPGGGIEILDTESGAPRRFFRMRTP